MNDTTLDTNDRIRHAERRPRSTLLAAVLVSVGAAPLALPLHAQEDVSMDLVGEIEPRCEFVRFDTRQLDFTVQSDARIDFDLYCNLGMTVSLSSKNGALLNEKLAARVERIPEHGREYDAVLTIDAGDFRLDTDSIAMQEGVSISTGEYVVFDTAGALDITLRAPLEGGYAGDYSDVISITLSPSLATLN